MPKVSINLLKYATNKDGSIVMSKDSPLRVFEKCVSQEWPDEKILAFESSNCDNKKLMLAGLLQANNCNEAEVYGRPSGTPEGPRAPMRTYDVKPRGRYSNMIKEKNAYEEID